jgi:hypothetical protein
MEAMLGISVWLCLSQLAKTLDLSYYCLSSLQQNWRKGQNRFCLETRGMGGEMTQTMYAHMNKEKKING